MPIILELMNQKTHLIVWVGLDTPPIKKQHAYYTKHRLLGSKPWF